MKSRSLSVGNVLPLFDPRSRLAYAVTATIVVSAAVSHRLSGLTVNWNFALSGVALLVIFVAVMLRRAGHGRTATGLETIGLMFFQGAAVLLLQFTAMTLPFPFTDQWLYAADRLLGFDFATFAGWFDSPSILRALAFAYRSMSWQILAVLVVLCAVRRERRAWQFATANIVALAVTIALFPFFPADGSFALCGIRPPSIPILPRYCDYGPILHQVKDGALTIIGPEMRLGLVSFPSYHTAAAVMLVWAAWPSRWLRAPMLLLNGALVIACIVLGSHYLIDILAGATVAWVAVFVTARPGRPILAEAQGKLLPT